MSREKQPWDLGNRVLITGSTIAPLQPKTEEILKKIKMIHNGITDIILTFVARKRVHGSK